MMAPNITHHADLAHRLEVVAISGPVTTSDHADSVARLGELAPNELALVVNLTGLTAVTDTGLAGMRRLAQRCAEAGRQLIFVCADMMMRAELVLADLDTLAPVVDADERAVALAA